MTRVSDSGAVLHGWPPQAPQYRTRAFGGLPDLEVEFHAPRPEVVTQILARCIYDADGVPYTAADVWQWTVARRTQALIAVVYACGVSAVAALAYCSRADEQSGDPCGERMELEFELASFAQATETYRCTWGNDANQVSLRLPTGGDQRQWLATPPADPDAFPVWMATSLVCEVDGAAPEAGWQLPAAWLAGVEDALAAQDPITDFHVAASCPHCGGALIVEVDLEALLLERLARLQQGLLFSVHRLASGYHWSETEILALPAWRRDYYLSAMRAEA